MTEKANETKKVVAGETKELATPKKKTTSKKTQTTKISATTEPLKVLRDPEVIEKLTGDVVSTELFSSENETQYKRLCEGIKKEMNTMTTSYLSIAQQLYKIHQEKLYQIGNYANVYDMAQDKFGMSRGNCNNYINICKRFGKIDASSNECIGLLPDYKNYSSSQLVELLQVPKTRLNEFKPDMSVREMRRKRKFYNENGIALENSEVKKVPTGKKKKLELLKVSDISEVLKPDNTILSEKLAEFVQSHPDAEYKLSITLVYEE